MGVSRCNCGLMTLGECRVLALLATGMTRREIADELVVSVYTINTQLSSVYSKIGVSKNGKAMRWALEHCSVDEQDS